MEFNKELFGKNIRALREAMGKNMPEVEADTGIKRATIGLWERGGGGIGLDSACILADYYGVSLDDLCQKEFSLVLKEV